MSDDVAEKPSWEFPRGHEIAPGRTTLRPLGGGNRCEVYLVWDEARRRRMVAKVLRRNLVGDDRALRALRREQEAHEALVHPGLVRAVGSWFDGPYPHLVVEHVNGPTLRRLIRRDGALPAEDVLALALEVGSVIDRMGREGWVHLDVKPGNLVMGGPPRLIDLSLARPIERARRLTSPVGTNAYMAPEQIHWHGDVGPNTDVWGLGATLYHAVAGRRPFREPRTREEDAPLEDRFPQLEDDPLPWSVRVPGAMSDAILACLDKDPARRPTPAELAEMLQPMGTEPLCRL
jgi:eukaryotic-like serine/threonine-protein kinase